MHRFFVPAVEGDGAVITDAVQLHHIRDVLRLKAGDEVTVADGAGREFRGVITGLEKQQVILRLAPLLVQNRPTAALTVACAIPKGGRLDDAIDDLTQLGVARIIPMMTERVVVTLDGTKAAARVERWRKIAENAARQCRRATLPEVTPVTAVGEVIKGAAEYDLKLIPHIAGRRRRLKSVIAKGSYNNIIVLIGPEGDFTPGEVEQALHNGFVPVSLGTTILRVTTAAVAVASYIRLALDR